MKAKTARYTLLLLITPCIVIYFLYGQFDAPRSFRLPSPITNLLRPTPNNVLNETARDERLKHARKVLRFETIPSDAETRDPEWDDKRQTIKRMMSEAWNGYVKYSWGYNELRPVTRDVKLDSIFGSSKIGATIVDSLDTLLIMNMTQEFMQARQWVANDFDFAATNHQLSVFETVIRYVGGLLSTYALTGDELFLNKSLQVAETLLPAYKTPTGKFVQIISQSPTIFFIFSSLIFVGLPHGLIVPSTGRSYHHSWAYGSILSEMGSQHLEYVYLSDVSGDFRYRDVAFKIRGLLNRTEKPDGLYMTMMDTEKGKWNENRSTVGALGDSFYEYLIKAYIQSGKQDKMALRMYLDALKGIEANGMIRKSTKSELVYLADWVYGRTNQKMQHLTCFAGGMYSLGSVNMELEDPLINQHHMELAKNLTETCYQSYRRTPTRLGPESFYFDDLDDATAQNGDYYILRPEVIESYFVMWRLTHNEIYRQYAWEAAQAIQRHCRTGNGYSGIENVMVNPAHKDNTQQSFFLAETLKYLYLIFSNDKLIPLDRWVFNTEAHPLPVCGVNSAYPNELCSVISD